ncbi:MAG: hypothetical protein LAP87_28425 [Acidobacteriia bacterium]|nr:hypothetical protein [Terriglobia bacterium]
MSLGGFQRAVVDLTLSPRKARALRGGEAGLLADYHLTGRERERILDMVRQPGMAVSCTLSRGNRLEAITEVFPMTCTLLAPVLRNLVDELWEERQPANYQLAGEDAAFAATIGRRMAAGELSIEYLAEIFAYEMVCREMARRMRSHTGPAGGVEAIVEFQHAPDDLLPPLSRLTAPPAGLPPSPCRVRVELRDGRFEVEVLRAPAGTSASLSA